MKRGIPVADLIGYREQTLHIARFSAGKRAIPARPGTRLRNLRQPVAGARQRHFGRAWLHVQPSRRRPQRRGQAGPRRGRGRGRLVRRADRPRQGGRYRSAFRGLGECAGLGAWQHRAQLHRSAHRQALWADLPRHHHARHRGGGEAAGRFARPQKPGRGDRPVDGRLPVVPVGGLLSRLHEGDRALGHRAAFAGRTRPSGGAAETAGQRSQLERRLVLRQWRHRQDTRGAALRDA